MFEAAGGDLVYYVFCGPTPRDVLDRYTALTGRTPMPPLWALGNQQSRWSYMSADELRAIAAGFREREIPCDVLYLDIDYMDGYRVFTWDSRALPGPGRADRRAARAGLPRGDDRRPGREGRRRATRVYAEGRDARLFCLTRDGEEYRNEVWPGLCAFPDFTDPAVRDVVGRRSTQALLDAGVAGVWCDMNEPALFVPQRRRRCPPDVVHPRRRPRRGCTPRSTTRTARSWRGPRARGCGACGRSGGRS